MAELSLLKRSSVAYTAAACFIRGGKCTRGILRQPERITLYADGPSDHFQRGGQRANGFLCANAP